MLKNPCELTRLFTKFFLGFLILFEVTKNKNFAEQVIQQWYASLELRSSQTVMLEVLKNWVFASHKNLSENQRFFCC